MCVCACVIFNAVRWFTLFFVTKIYMLAIVVLTAMVVAVVVGAIFIVSKYSNRFVVIVLVCAYRYYCKYIFIISSFCCYCLLKVAVLCSIPPGRRTRGTA
eukprot:Rmarinus@m.14704